MKSMNQGLVYRFLFRWVVCSLGLWIAGGLLSGVQYDGGLRVVLVAGLLLAIINAIIRPVVVILSLPAILFTLGLFMIVINGFSVLLASWIYEPLHIKSFWVAILAGMVIGLVNYLLTTIVESRRA